MKNPIKLIVVILAVAAVFLLASCDEKGGTIEVTNSYNDPTGMVSGNVITIVKGADIGTALSDVANGKGTQMKKGETKSFTFDEDGTYTVVALLPLGFMSPVILLGGNTAKVTIK